MVIFLDEAANPLPPGVFVTLQTAAGVQVGSGYLLVGGKLNVAVMGAIEYSASFRGRQGPTSAVSFYGNSTFGQNTTVTVAGYRSPTMNIAGYTQEVADLYPRGWLSSSATQKGGNAYALFSSLAQAPAKLDAEIMGLQGALRPFTCQGSDLDSWASDFFGGFLPRYTNEDDATYLGRILAAFGPRCTLAAIQQMVVQFYSATLWERQQQAQQNMGYDTTGGYDNRGGYDTYVPAVSDSVLTPSVSVWDGSSRPDLAMQYGIAPPTFVIAIAFADPSAGWFLDYSYLDYSATLIDVGSITLSTAAPDARLGALVNLVKAAGAQPMYATGVIP